jgi:hypothetical protein
MSRRRTRFNAVDEVGHHRIAAEVVKPGQTDPELQGISDTYFKLAPFAVIVGHADFGPQKIAFLQFRLRTIFTVIGSVWALIER